MIERLSVRASALLTKAKDEGRYVGLVPLKEGGAYHKIIAIEGGVFMFPAIPLEQWDVLDQQTRRTVR